MPDASHREQHLSGGRRDVPPGSRLYRCTVMHRRLKPFGHRFAYRVTSLLVDLDALPVLSRELRLFSWNRPNLVSFYDRDHGARDGSPLKPWIAAQLTRHGRLFPLGRVQLLCFPRLMQLVFNPLSVFFCHDTDGRLRAILYDVRNTFGDKHGYLIDVDVERPEGAPIVQTCEKRFYVSPFLPITGSYRFRLMPPDDRLSILIRQSGEIGEQLLATQVGIAESLSDRSLAALLLRQPLMTITVVAAIHWQALLIWIKGAAFHRRPPPPEHQTTGIDPR